MKRALSTEDVGCEEEGEVMKRGCKIGVRPRIGGGRVSLEAIRGEGKII